MRSNMFIATIIGGLTVAVPVFAQEAGLTPVPSSEVSAAPVEAVPQAPPISASQATDTTTPVEATPVAAAAAPAVTVSSVNDPHDNPVPLKLGMNFSVALFSGVAAGVDVRLPSVPWFKLYVDGTYLLAPGMQGGVLIDPINFPIVPVANIDLGHQFQFSAPGVKNSPSIDFTYVDLNLGLGIGSRDSFRFLIMSGMSYLTGTAHNFQGVIPATDGLTVGDPNFHGWAPNVKFGFSLLF